MISILPSVRVLPEDLPEEVAGALPGIGYLTELNLTPINASESTKSFAVRTAVAIAKTSHGVMLDPQTQAVTLPSGVRRYTKPAPDGNASALSFSWWFVDGPLTENRFDELLDVLEAELPEAMPRRYGLFEPPQHVYAEEGREHFVKFLATHADDGPIWYPSAPVFDVSLRIPSPIGAIKQGFRSGMFSIDVNLCALKQPGWQSSLKRMWQRVSAIVQPFYGDVRTLHGFKLHRGRLFVTRGTMRHPVKVWWWPGIPPGPAQAIVLGKRYADLWPAFRENSGVFASLHFADTGDWSATRDVYDKIGQAPSEILRRDVSSVVPAEYPVGWPFDASRTAH